MTGETETRLTESVSAQVTEHIEIAVTEGFDAKVAEAELQATPKIQHAVPDRGDFAITFPKLDGYRVEIADEVLHPDFTTASRVHLDQELTARPLLHRSRGRSTAPHPDHASLEGGVL